MERFHIGEWYGHPFLNLSDQDRLLLAAHKVGGAAMSKQETKRLENLEQKLLSTGLTSFEMTRLEALRAKLAIQNEKERPCPFRTDISHPTCTKPGGVCSLRLYTDAGGSVSPVGGDKGLLRALCPYRFHQGGVVFSHVGATLLGDAAPRQAAEVGFLESTGNLDSAAGEDVGRIDMILVGEAAGEDRFNWAAVEVQAVYFSGKEMAIEFRHLEKNHGKLSMAQKVRRPDYRSSGPKRLMPQLQIKVPTLRRWGKKMVVVVDLPFYRSMGHMRVVPHVSNADIVWCVVDFVEVKTGAYFMIKVIEEHYTTLESAIEGLTGGDPVSMEEFEQRIRVKIGP